MAAYSQTDQTAQSTVIINVSKQNYGQTLLRYFPAALIQNDYREEAEYDVMILLGEELN